MTKIEWTDKAWNPIIGGSKVSPACDNCYAERMAFRLAHNPKAPLEYKQVVNDFGNWKGKTSLVSSTLEKPLHWRKPCLVFVGSMTDLFHEDTPDEWLDRVFAIMARTHWHTFLVLTKRPKRAKAYLCDKDTPLRAETCLRHRRVTRKEKNIPDAIIHNGRLFPRWPLPNVWLGVIVEDQRIADEHIPILLDTPAAIRFVSVEQMLGPINLLGYINIPSHFEWEGTKELPVLDWVICRGRIGPGEKLMNPDWSRSLRVQCREAGVPFFFGHLPKEIKVPGDLLIRQFPEKHHD